MADFVTKIKLGEEEYDIQDATARSSIEELNGKYNNLATSVKTATDKIDKLFENENAELKAIIDSTVDALDSETSEKINKIHITFYLNPYNESATLDFTNENSSLDGTIYGIEDLAKAAFISADNGVKDLKDAIIGGVQSEEWNNEPLSSNRYDNSYPLLTDKVEDINKVLNKLKTELHLLDTDTLKSIENKLKQYSNKKITYEVKDWNESFDTGLSMYGMEFRPVWDSDLGAWRKSLKGEIIFPNYFAIATKKDQSLIFNQDQLKTNCQGQITLYGEKFAVSDNSTITSNIDVTKHFLFKPENGQLKIEIATLGPEDQSHVVNGISAFVFLKGEN